ncbi:hypothetical protein TruAng_004692 [Truncatella angustata]|nr:hypothetical protein TruAng_004692 [Truncatella angustata]
MGDFLISKEANRWYSDYAGWPGPRHPQCGKVDDPLEDHSFFRPATVEDLDDDSGLFEEHFQAMEEDWELNGTDLFYEMTDLAQFVALQFQIVNDHTRFTRATVSDAFGPTENGPS